MSVCMRTCAYKHCLATVILKKWVVLIFYSVFWRGRVLHAHQRNRECLTPRVQHRWMFFFVFFWKLCVLDVYHVCVVFVCHNSIKGNCDHCDPPQSPQPLCQIVWSLTILTVLAEIGPIHICKMVFSCSLHHLAFSFTKLISRHWQFIVFPCTI